MDANEVAEVEAAIVELDGIADWLDGYENGRGKGVLAIADRLRRLIDPGTQTIPATGPTREGSTGDGD